MHVATLLSWSFRCSSIRAWMLSLNRSLEPPLPARMPSTMLCAFPSIGFLSVPSLVLVSVSWLLPPPLMLRLWMEASCSACLLLTQDLNLASIRSLGGAVLATKATCLTIWSSAFLLHVLLITVALPSFLLPWRVCGAFLLELSAFPCSTFFLVLAFAPFLEACTLGSIL